MNKNSFRQIVEEQLIQAYRRILYPPPVTLALKQDLGFFYGFEKRDPNLIAKMGILNPEQHDEMYLLIDQALQQSKSTFSLFSLSGNKKSFFPNNKIPENHYQITITLTNTSRWAKSKFNFFGKKVKYRPLACGEYFKISAYGCTMVRHAQTTTWYFTYTRPTLSEACLAVNNHFHKMVPKLLACKDNKYWPTEIPSTRICQGTILWSDFDRPIGESRGPKPSRNKSGDLNQPIDCLEEYMAKINKAVINGSAIPWVHEVTEEEVTKETLNCKILRNTFQDPSEIRTNVILQRYKQANR